MYIRYMAGDGPLLKPQMNLQPVDFYAAAKRGAFVYCYLRAADHSPYYVGVATRGDRPTSKQHSFHIPADRALIRILRSGLSRDDATRWEIFYIAHYGRVDLGTGILRNLTDGGDGVVGRPWTDAERLAAAERMRGRTASAATRQRMSDAQRGLTSPAKRAAGARRALADATAWAVANGVDTDRYLALTYVERDTFRKRLGLGYDMDFAFNGLGDNATVLAGRELAGEKQKRSAAARYGIDADLYLSFTDKQRQKIACRYSDGMRGEQLIQHLDMDSRTANALIRFDLSLEIWETLSRKSRGLIRARYNLGKRGADLTAGLMAA